MIHIKVDASSTLRMLENGQKQARYAAAVALNTCAFNGMREGRKHLEQRLDKPTRWTVSSWYVRKKAKKTDLVAVVGWSDYLANKRGNAADYYLSQHWNGGRREYKAFEQRLIRAGVMPSGMYAVPGQAADDLKMIDRNGNMKAGVLVAILSALSTFTEAGYNGNASTRQARRLSANKMASRLVYWAGKPGKNTPNGIWVIDEKYSKRGRLRPVMVFVRSPNYSKRLDLDGVANKAKSGFDQAFKLAYAQAMITARPA
jgi:hypothetical protein